MTFKKKLNLVLHTAKIETMNRMDNPLAFTFLIFGVVARIAVTLVFFQALYLQVDTLGGWDLNQVYVLLGTYFLIGVIAWSSYTRGYNRLPRFIENGDLDLMLSKPINIRTFMIYRYVDILFSLPEFAISIGLIIYGALGGANLNIVYYIIALIIGIMIHYSLVLILYSINFFYIMHNTTYLGQEMFKLGQYPISIYRGTVRLVLSIIIPLAFIYSLPASILFGKATFANLLVGGLIAIIFYIASTSFFSFGLKHYESAQG